MRWVVKVGSSVLSDPRGELRLEVLTSLAREVVDLWRNGVEVVLVTSGAVACGFRPLGLERPPVGLPERQASAAVGQLYLLSHYEQVFRESGFHLGQILLTHDDFQNRHRYLHARNTLETLLRYRCIPVVNENDAVATEEILFGDNDQLAVLVAAMVEARLVIFLSDIPGVYDRNPSEPGARLLGEIPDPRSLARTIPPGKNLLGRGGIHSKLLASARAQELGIPSWIARGTEPHILKKIFNGEEIGTRVPASRKVLSAKKFWLRYGVRPRGNLIVDEGAVRALTLKNKSLLPSGILEVVGDFQVGDPVQVLDCEGTPIAYGLTEYSADELRRILKRKTTEIPEILGYKRTDEVIHRNDLVLLKDHLLPS